MNWKSGVIRLLMFSCIVLVPYSMVFGQDLGKYQAMYIYNFTKYIQWPNNNGQLVIGAIGTETIDRELENMVAAKGDGKLKYKKLASYDEITECDVIFLTEDQDKNLDLVLEKTKGKSILIISENENSINNGAGISFFLDGDKLKFSINKNAVEDRNLKISASLLTLAKVI